jgi:hypothetical protein
MLMRRRVGSYPGQYPRTEDVEEGCRLVPCRVQGGVNTERERARVKEYLETEKQQIAGLHQPMLHAPLSPVEGELLQGLSSEFQTAGEGQFHQKHPSPHPDPGQGLAPFSPFQHPWIEILRAPRVIVLPPDPRPKGCTSTSGTSRCQEPRSSRVESCASRLRAMVT